MLQIFSRENLHRQGNLHTFANNKGSANVVAHYNYNRLRRVVGVLSEGLGVPPNNPTRNTETHERKTSNINPH